jgi:hypothetical protein
VDGSPSRPGSALAREVIAMAFGAKIQEVKLGA